MAGHQAFFSLGRSASSTTAKRISFSSRESENIRKPWVKFICRQSANKCPIHRGTLRSSSRNYWVSSNPSTVSTLKKSFMFTSSVGSRNNRLLQSLLRMGQEYHSSWNTKMNNKIHFKYFVQLQFHLFFNSLLFSHLLTLLVFEVNSSYRPYFTRYFEMIVSFEEAVYKTTFSLIWHSSFGV